MWTDRQSNIASLRDDNLCRQSIGNHRSNLVRSGTSMRLLDMYSNDVKCKNVFSLFPFLSPRSAFTLSEVLITLGIIGIVAGMTIPSLINTVEEYIFTNQYKKLYSTISNVVNKTNIDQDYIITAFSDISYNTNFGALYPNLNIVKTCTGPERCWTQDQVLGLNGSDITSYDGYFGVLKSSVASILADGTVISTANLSAMYGAGKAYVIIPVDLNGKKGPNRLGRDIHLMAFVDSLTTEPKLIPYYSRGLPFNRDTYSKTDVTVGCSGLGVAGTQNRGYTCGAKWMTGD